MSGKQAIYGIIGLPLQHSLSPVMHNTAFKELRLKAEYKLFPLQEEDLENFFDELRLSSSPIMGLNVTVPYKEKVIPYLDHISPYATKAMAVNTVTIAPNRGLTGFNTDGPGFLTHLTELGFQTADKRIDIIGSGGTARGIISVLCLIPERPHSIRVYNRHPEKTVKLLKDLGERMDVSCVESVSSIDDLNIELSDLLINTTPIGLNPDDPSLINMELLHSNLLVYDVIYNPPQTPLLKMAEQKGAQTSNGLGMLFYQGTLAFQHWTGYELDQKIKTKIKAALETGGKDAQG